MFRGKQEYDYEQLGLLLCELRNQHRGENDDPWTVDMLFPNLKRRKKKRKREPESEPKSDLPVMSLDGLFSLMTGKPVPPGSISYE